jgi:hypothetical protein
MRAAGRFHRAVQPDLSAGFALLLWPRENGTTRTIIASRRGHAPGAVSRCTQLQITALSCLYNGAVCGYLILMSMDLWIVLIVAVVWISSAPVMRFFASLFGRRKRERNYGRVSSSSRRPMASFSVRTGRA